MRFDQEQEELRATVRRLVTRAPGPEVWGLLAGQIGAHALAIPEAFGGAGFSMLETHVVLEELGAGLLAPAFLSTTLAAQAMLLADDDAVKARLLPGIAAGETVATLAWAEGGSWARPGATRAHQGPDGWLVTGRKDHVLDGDTADVFVVFARVGDGVGMFEVARADAGVVPQTAVDPHRPQASVEFRGAAARLLCVDARDAMDQVLDAACVAISAEQVGGMQRALDMSVEYAKTRVQFGRPIGAFQAVKHRLADLFVLVESARSASYGAAFAMTSQTARTAGVAKGSEREAGAAASRAKAYCSEAFSTVAGEAIQVHGGIGITWEHPIHFYFKRAHATAQLFGAASEHRRRYARLSGLAAQDGRNASTAMATLPMA